MSKEVNWKEVYYRLNQVVKGDLYMSLWHDEDGQEILHLIEEAEEIAHFHIPEEDW